MKRPPRRIVTHGEVRQTENLRTSQVTIHRFVACKTYHRRLGPPTSFAVLSLYHAITSWCRCFLALPLRRSIALSHYRTVALLCRHCAAPLSAPSLYRSSALPLYRSGALPLRHYTAPSLRKCLALRGTAEKPERERAGKSGAV